MTTAKAKEKGDAPRLERRWVVVPDQLPEAIIERHRAVSQNPEVHAAYARTVREKADKFGLLHRDADTGYQARFPAGDVPDALKFVSTAA